ncbi:hypothetical protein ACTXT7_004700 [Hymenolepis weldensis]
MPVCRPKRSALVNNKCKQPEEIRLVKSVSHSNRAVSKVTAQNADEIAFPYRQDLICTQTNPTWSHSDLGLTGPIGGISSLIQVDSYSKWPEVIPIKSVTTGSVINSLHQDFCRSLNISLLHSPLDLNGLNKQIVDNV